MDAWNWGASNFNFLLDVHSPFGAGSRLVIIRRGLLAISWHREQLLHHSFHTLEPSAGRREFFFQDVYPSPHVLRVILLSILLHNSLALSLILGLIIIVALLGASGDLGGFGTVSGRVPGSFFTVS